MAFLNSISDVSIRTWNCGGPFKVVQTPNGSLYAFHIGPGSDGSTSAACYYSKSTDYGRTWSHVAVDTVNTHTWCSIWYDRWSGINGDLIHIAFADTTSDDVFYRGLDTTTDTLGTEQTVFNGATALATAGSTGSIVVARGGNIYIYFDIDAGAEIGFYRSTDAGVNWSSRAALGEATLDQVILMPGYAADSQDIMAFFWDASADEISRKVYDDSANTWTETSISTGMVEPTASVSQYGWSALADLTNSKNILVAWNGYDTANADLKAWSVDESTVTALTDVVLNATDDCYLAALSIYGTELRAYYAGKSNGTSVIFGWSPVMRKTSTDGGTTWGAETEFMPSQDYRGLFAPMIQYATQGFCVGAIATGTANSNGMVNSVSDLSPGTTNAIGIS